MLGFLRFDPYPDTCGIGARFAPHGQSEAADPSEHCLKAHVARSLFSHASTGRHTSIPYTLHLSLPFETAEPRSHRWLRSRIGPWTTDRTTVLYKLIGSLRKHGRMPCPHVARHKILARVRSLVVKRSQLCLEPAQRQPCMWPAPSHPPSQPRRKWHNALTVGPARVSWVASP